MSALSNFAAATSGNEVVIPAGISFPSLILGKIITSVAFPFEILNFADYYLYPPKLNEKSSLDVYVSKKSISLVNIQIFNRGVEFKLSKLIINRFLEARELNRK